MKAGKPSGLLLFLQESLKAMLVVVKSSRACFWGNLIRKASKKEGWHDILLERRKDRMTA
jgi:hypothetical protein